MDELRGLALDAALDLDRAVRGRPAPTEAAAALALRYAIPEIRRTPRHRRAHARALAAIGRPPPDPADVDAALARIGLDLARACEDRGDVILLVRCREFCLALHEALGEGKVGHGP